MDILEVRTTMVQAAREYQVSESSISKWKRQFIDAGRLGLTPGRSAESSHRAAELEAGNELLRAALDQTMALARVWRMFAESRLGPFPDLEMIRRGAGTSVLRFCCLVGIPRRTYFRKQSQLKSGDLAARGPWPSPSADAAAKLLANYLAEHEGVGHRRLHALLTAICSFRLWS